MRKIIFFILISFAAGSIVSNSDSFAGKSRKQIESDADSLKEIEGEVLRFYEDRSGEWTSYILLRDTFGTERTIYVHPVLTLVKRNDQILELHQITGGMKATVIYQKPFRDARAVSITVSGIFYG